MKVLLVNGSPRPNGCTNRALTEIANELQKNDIETQIFHIGNKPISGCIACNVCYKRGQCFMEDKVAEFAELAKTADGFMFGSPVYFAGINGSLKSFMDRLFYSQKKIFHLKPTAGIISLRRGGATPAFDQLNKYFTIRQMPIISSQYWNMVHGNTPEEVEKDAEGLQIMRTLGKNMAWLLKCIKAGEQSGIAHPENEPQIRTNFIR